MSSTFRYFGFAIATHLSMEPTRSCIEEINIVLVGETLLRRPERWVSGCEQCSEIAPITFDYLLDALTNYDPKKTEYLMCRAARCPSCLGEITEKTLVSV